MTIRTQAYRMLIVAAIASPSGAPSPAFAQSPTCNCNPPAFCGANATCRLGGCTHTGQFVGHCVNVSGGGSGGDRSIDDTLAAPSGGPERTSRPRTIAPRAVPDGD